MTTLAVVRTCTRETGHQLVSVGGPWLTRYAQTLALTHAPIDRASKSIVVFSKVLFSFAVEWSGWRGAVGAERFTAQNRSEE